MRTARGALVALVAIAGRLWAAEVAVLVEPGMIRYGGTPALTARRMADTLRSAGIEADTLTAGQVADPQAFGAGRYAVLVVPYGNAFPLSGFAQMRAFHRAGGGLVMTGVPFCHPCVRSAPGPWRDLGHTSYFAHDERGIGTGGFGGPATRDGRLVVAAGNPLRVTGGILPRKSGRPQWLAASALAGEDEVLPLIELRVPGEPVRHAAALVRHRCRRFAGARDVWLGQTASAFTIEDRYAAEQLVARGVGWCLFEKGKLSRKQFDALLARLDAAPKPKPLPDQLEIVREPRPWGDTFFPKSKPPARELFAVDARRLSRWEKLALTCLQGLTSRERPRLWLIFSPWDERWLAWHKQKGHIDGHHQVEDWRGLFRQFAGVFRGAVVPDGTLYRGELLACNLAAVEDCIVAPLPLARGLGLEVKHDLRGRFKTYADGMRWLWETYRDRFSHHLCAYVHPDLTWILGYDIQWRGLMFWICGEKDGDRPGADALAEMRVMAEIFSKMPPNIGMRSFPWHGHGVGLEDWMSGGLDGWMAG